VWRPEAASVTASAIGAAQVDSLLDLSSQAELSQRARGQLTQSGLGVLGARLVSLDDEGNLVGEARRLQDQLAACSLKPLSR